MKKTQENIYCDFCEKEISKESDHIATDDVPHEGCSTIDLWKDGVRAFSFGVGCQHYCDMGCLIGDIRKELKIGAKS